MGFLSRSSSTNQYTQNVSTITQTSVGDVGITGSQAVELNRDVATTLSGISKDNVAAFQLFSGGAERITGKALDFGRDAVGDAYKDVSLSRKSNENILASFLDFGKKIIGGSFEDAAISRSENRKIVESALDQANQSAGNISSVMVKYGTFAIIVIGSLWALKKGK